MSKKMTWGEFKKMINYPKEIEVLEFGYHPDKDCFVHADGRIETAYEQFCNDSVRLTMGNVND